MTDTSGYIQVNDPYGTQTVVADVAMQIAQQYGVDPTRLINIALATMMQESGGNPYAVGDNGTSFGIYQLHEGGELGNLTQQQADDPTTNARVAITRIAQVLKANPNADDGTIAAMAQRPADASGYAQSVDATLHGAGVQGNTTFAGTVTTPTTGGGTVNGPGASSGQQLSMNDIGSVDTWIRQNWGPEAWFLDIPEVKQILEQGAVNVADGKSSQDAVIYQIEQTDWWKQTSATYRQFLQNKATTPGEYDFNVAGSQAQQALANVKAMAAQYGVTLSNGQAQQIAMTSLKYGFTSQQLRMAIGNTIVYNQKQDTAGAVVKQLQAASGQYLLNSTDPTLQSWAQGLAGGTQTIDQFNKWLADQASNKWTGMADQIKQGYTPNQIIDTYRQDAAKIMEVDPNSIDFVNNPMYSKILDYVPPGQNTSLKSGAPPEHRMMTNSEMQQYLRGQSGWQYTQNARDSYAGLAHQVLSTWGEVA